MSITVTSNDVLIGKGRTVVFNAESRGIGNLTYQWWKRGSNGLPGKVLGINTRTLTIPNINKFDEGDYYCNATNIWKRTMKSNSVTLKVYGMLVYFAVCANLV